MRYIDAHAHIYPDDIAARASQATAEFYDIPMNCDGRLSSLLARGELAGIEKHMVLGVAISPERVENINNFLIRAVAENPDRLIGLGAIHPEMPDVQQELRRIRAAGLIGVKLHADMQQTALDGGPAIVLFKALAEENMPAILHMGDPRYSYSSPRQLQKALVAVPELKVIAAHFGGWQEWDESWRCLADLDNVWVDTSSSLYAFTPEEAAKLLRRFRPDRVVFATDFPMWDPVIERRRFDALPLTATEKEKIGRRNIEAFLRQFSSPVPAAYTNQDRIDS
ncbi:MAG: amidohydrolase family protein [Firmicutes bacterium]|nr:amidohydrolase family protein [Bacillota bacterium]